MDALTKAFLEWANRKGYDTAHAYNQNEIRWIFLSPMTADVYEAWQAARTVPEGSMVVSAKWIERHAGPEDHACGRCYPHSDMLVDGFLCYYHKALDVIAAAQEPKK